MPETGKRATEQPDKSHVHDSNKDVTVSVKLKLDNVGSVNSWEHVRPIDH